MDGSDEQKPWTRRTAQKYLSHLKYWDFCREHKVAEKSNIIIHNEIRSKFLETKAQRSVGKYAHLPYRLVECWELYRAIRNREDQLADMIMLGMYTACRIGELAHMKPEDVSDYSFTVAASKKDVDLRNIPIRKIFSSLSNF